MLFLSTLSLRRATARCRFWALSNAISIHALLAESDLSAYVRVTQRQRISIHALLAESDLMFLLSSTKRQKFLSTLSLRRATSNKLAGQNYKKISIHALLAESDILLQRSVNCNYHFYPRSPCGERQSNKLAGQNYKKISIHALLAESDNIIDSNCNLAQKFLSTLSLRRATAKVHKTVGYFCAYETNFMEIASSC